MSEMIIQILTGEYSSSVYSISANIQTLFPCVHVFLRCACQFEGNNPKNALISAGSGVGAVENFKDFIGDDKIVLGLVKVVRVYQYIIYYVISYPPCVYRVM